MWVMMMMTAAAAMTLLPAQGQMCHHTASLQPPTQPRLPTSALPPL